MKNYFEHMKTKTPHARRQHAMQVSGALVSIIFVAWLATLSLRFTSTPPQTALGTTNEQLAGVASGYGAQNGQATLLVSTTTTYTQ